MDFHSGGVVDRRGAPRTRLASEHGIVIVRIRPGHDAALIDVSADGALIETAHRLLPGRHIELHLETVDERAAIRGRVVRCAVAAVLPSRVRYQGAIGFERQLSWLAASNGGEYPVLTRQDGVSSRP